MQVASSSSSSSSEDEDDDDDNSDDQASTSSFDVGEEAIQLIEGVEKMLCKLSVRGVPITIHHNVDLTNKTEPLEARSQKDYQLFFEEYEAFAKS